MEMLDDPIFHRPIGAPVEDARDHSSGWLSRCFASGAVAWLDPRQPHRGCVVWDGGDETGECPTFARGPSAPYCCSQFAPPDPPPPLLPPQRPPPSPVTPPLRSPSPSAPPSPSPSPSLPPSLPPPVSPPAPPVGAAPASPAATAGVIGGAMEASLGAAACILMALSLGMRHARLGRHRGGEQDTRRSSRPRATARRTRCSKKGFRALDAAAPDQALGGF
jgi:hypothetical protein